MSAYFFADCKEVIMNTTIFENIESNVRSYCRSFPTVFTKAKGAVMTDENGKNYIDFFAGAGALNYGHNNDYIKEQIISYLESDGIIHSLDMFTSAKRDFIEYFDATPSHAQAIEMKKLSQKGELKIDDIKTIMKREKPNQIEKIKFDATRIRNVLPKNIEESKVEDYVVNALKFYERHLKQREMSER